MKEARSRDCGSQSFESSRTISMSTIAARGLSGRVLSLSVSDWKNNIEEQSVRIEHARLEVRSPRV